MSWRTFNFLPALLLMILSPAGEGVARTDLSFTADTEGHVIACLSCPAGKGLGGLDRRGSLLKQVRHDHEKLLLLDAGNALFGMDSLHSRGKVIVAAYDAMGYDAVNLSYRDFRLGKAATLEALAGAEFAVLSANVFDEETGELIGRPYIVREVAGVKTAIVGATDVPAALAVLPHLKEQLAGVRLDPPAEALEKWLPQARQETERVILLYYGSGPSVRRIREQFADQVDLILVGGERPAYLSGEGSPAVVGTHHHGTHLARVSITEAEGIWQVEATQVTIEPSIEPDEAMTKLLAELEAPRRERPSAAQLAERPPPTLPAKLESGEIYRLGSYSGNRAVRLTVIHASLTSEYGGTAASAGNELLLLNTEWENIIPLALVLGENLPTMVRAENLADHFYVVLNDNRLVRLRADAARLPGHVPVSPFVLPEMGSTISGNMIFEIPAENVKSLELRLYEYAHGPFRLPLMVNDEMSDSGPAIGEVQSNEVLEAGVFGVERVRRLRGEAAPDGMEFVVIEFRARSLFTMEGDATAYDPHAKAGTKIEIGSVADWADWRANTRLVAGDERYPPHELTELPDEPRFLPDLFTGGRLVFLVPKGGALSALHCGFPNAMVPGRGLIHPEALSFPLDDPPAAESAGSVDEDQPPRPPVRRLMVPETAPLD